METAHNADPVPDLWMCDLFIAHVQNRTESDATIQNLAREHEISARSKCCFASAVNGGVNGHIHQCKKGSAMELKATAFPDLIPGVRGDCNDAGDMLNEDLEDLSELNAKMSTEELNEVSRVLLRKLTEMTKHGVKIRHPMHAESKEIKDSQEVTVYVHGSLVPQYERFAQCDFEEKDGGMELCWHLLRKKIRQLCNMTEAL
jgi:hypothetical protein